MRVFIKKTVKVLSSLIRMALVFTGTVKLDKSISAEWIPHHEKDLFIP